MLFHELQLIKFTKDFTLGDLNLLVLPSFRHHLFSLP